MGELPKEAIIILIIIGAGICVLVAWAIHSAWHGQRPGAEDEKIVSEGEMQQAAYRQEVIQRNHRAIAAMNGFRYPPTQSHRYSEV